MILINLRIKKLEHLTSNLKVKLITRKSEHGSNLNSLYLNQFETSQVVFDKNQNFDHSYKIINRNIKIIESSFILSASPNFKSQMEIQSELNDTSSNNVQLLNFYQFLDDALKWIEKIDKEISNFDFNNDIYDKINQRIEEIKNEVKIFYEKLDTINLLDFSNYPDLKQKIDKTFSKFNYLCRNLKKSFEYLEMFALFLQSFKDEMKELNNIENIELNRDWSVPNKQNIVELQKYKTHLLLNVNLRKINIKQVIFIANKLISLNHPAREMIDNKIKTLKHEFEWIENLLKLFEIHLKNLETYSKFNLKYIELWSELETFKDKSFNFNNIEKMNGQINQLNNMLIQLPSFKTRRLKITDVLPHAILLVDYKTLLTSFSMGENFKVLNNSNYLKWNIFSISQKCEDIIPSVCFIISGPDKELKKIVENCEKKLKKITNGINSENDFRFTNIKKSNECFNSEKKLLYKLDEKLTQMLESTDHKIKVLGNN